MASSFIVIAAHSIALTGFLGEIVNEQIRKLLRTIGYAYHIRALLYERGVHVGFIFKKLLEERKVVGAHSPYAFPAGLDSAASSVDLIVLFQERGILLNRLYVVVRLSDGGSSFSICSSQISKR